MPSVDASMTDASLATGLAAGAAAAVGGNGLSDKPEVSSNGGAILVRRYQCL